MPSPSYYDNWRIAVEDVHGTLLTRDLVTSQPKYTRRLNGPGEIEFKVLPFEPSVQGVNGKPIRFKSYGHWIHAIKERPDGTEWVWSGIIKDEPEIDPQTGAMSVRAIGYSDYPNDIPWLVNWNPIAIDPLTIVGEIWDHIQSFPQGNLGVVVYPRETEEGAKMLPGFSFNAEKYIGNFYAIFIRASDQQDCGKYLEKLARDIPFEYVEEVSWNSTHSGFDKKLHLGYPFIGVQHDDLIFRFGENVLQAKPKVQSLPWFSDIVIQGYYPGKVYSSLLSNADPDRYRRVKSEKDLNIDSNERAKAWAHRRLARRQAPDCFEHIVIDPYHPNAPFGTYEVGDLIRVQGPSYWIGDIDQFHKIMAMQYDGEKNQVQLQLEVDGAFNYDPIFYPPLEGAPDPPEGDPSYPSPVGAVPFNWGPPHPGA